MVMRRTHAQVQPVILRCYAVQRDGWWISHCLDLCLVSRGRSLEDAQEALRENILGYLETVKPRDIRQAFRPAPLVSRIEYSFMLIAHLLHLTKRRFLGDLAWTGTKLIPAGA